MNDIHNTSTTRYIDDRSTSQGWSINIDDISKGYHPLSDNTSELRTKTPTPQDDYIAWVVKFLQFQFGQDSRLYYNKIAENVNDMEKTVVLEYTQIPKVTLITLTKAPDYYMFNVFTSNPTYDAILMDKLLDTEIRILDRYTKQLIGFHYYTFNPATYKDIPVSEEEKVIFKVNNG